MAINVTLTPALERFARKCVRTGRYNNISEVVQSGLRLLQEAEERRHQFQAMLREAERDGKFTLESVVAEAYRIIDQSDR